jgi:hypothetical protein
MAIDQQKLQTFLGKAVMDMGAAFSAALVVIGEKTGLYKAMAGAGPMTSAELAKKTGTAERYVREWLAAQAAGGYVTYDAASGRYKLPEERRLPSPTKIVRRIYRARFNLLLQRSGMSPS